MVMESFGGIDLASFIVAAGLLGLFFMVFAESGLLIGFFFPGDSLLFTAGFLASQGFFNIWILVAISFAGAVLGDSFGYAFGKKTGPMIFRKDDSILFNRRHLERAAIFYERHGGITIVLARFLPVIRTFVPILAGVGRMRYGTFLFYNVFGAAFWAVGLPLAGFFLGKTVPGADRYLLPIIAAIIVISSIPPLLHFLRNPEDRRRIWNFLRRKKYD